MFLFSRGNQMKSPYGSFLETLCQELAVSLKQSKFVETSNRLKFVRSAHVFDFEPFKST